MQSSMFLLLVACCCACASSSSVGPCPCPNTDSIVEVPAGKQVATVSATGPCTVTQEPCSTDDGSACVDLYIHGTAVGLCKVTIQLTTGSSVAGTLDFKDAGGCCSGSFQGTQSGFAF